jgi:hypothetical protein
MRFYGGWCYRYMVGQLYRWRLKVHGSAWDCQW